MPFFWCQELWSRLACSLFCTLCSWNRIWTRCSSIWKKWGSLTCLASVKQQGHGNASCATTLKRLLVSTPPCYEEPAMHPQMYRGLWAQWLYLAFFFVNAPIVLIYRVVSDLCLILRKASHWDGCAKKGGKMLEGREIQNQKWERRIFDQFVVIKRTRSGWICGRVLAKQVGSPRFNLQYLRREERWERGMNERRKRHFTLKVTVLPKWPWSLGETFCPTVFQSLKELRPH